MPNNLFVGKIASGYDTASSDMFAPEVLEPAVTFLAEAAAGGAALELGIGTGRVALPLSQRGVRVHGIDISRDMIAHLQAKPGSDAIEVTVGDFASTKVPGTFALAYVVFNAISNLCTQDEQVACFCNVAAHLQPGGRFVMELWILDLQRLPPGDTFQSFDVSPSHLGIDEIDVASQLGVSHHYSIVGDRIEQFDSPWRHVWPAELDLMARIAGLALRERWADWDRSPFDGNSRKHISV
ncbi:MAG TPA: class I SAM-dependent methyltransferase, partial [Acidimicrobiia bacterium]|nr:class I SAM-dependent methyltransferase [Acidimicrobiia bacterium]